MPRVVCQAGLNSSTAQQCTTAASAAAAPVAALPGGKRQEHWCRAVPVASNMASVAANAAP